MNIEERVRELEDKYKRYLLKKIFQIFIYLCCFGSVYGDKLFCDAKFLQAKGLSFGGFRI